MNAQTAAPTIPVDSSETSRNSVPPPRVNGGLPLLGHMLEFGRNPFEMMVRARQECGEVAEFSLLNQEMVLMTGPEANAAFFQAPDEQLSQSEAYKLMTPIFGKGVVFDAPLERLNQQLTMLMPALRDKRMRTYAGIIAQEVEDMISGWGESGELDLLAFTKELTLYTSSHCLLGKEFRKDLNQEFAALYHDLEGGVKPIAYVFPNLPLPAFRRRDRARARLLELITEIIDKRRSGESAGEDALQTLLESTYEDGSGLTPNEITGMLTATMFAGHHTSAGTAAWILIDLLRNQRYMGPVLDELHSIYGGDGEVNFESLREIPKLESVIKEVLRLHPPLIFLMRRVMYDLDFKGYTIKAGKNVCASPAVSHRIPEVFPEPELFDPDRYSEGRAEDAPPFAWIAFGGGKHLCTGNAFGLMQLKAIFSILLRRYEFELIDAPESYQHDYQKMVVQPKQPCMVRYRRLTAAQRSRSAAGRAATAAATAAGEEAAEAVRVSVDLGLCKGHAVCMAEAPEIFRVGEAKDSQAEVIDAEPPAELGAKLRAAVKYCPTGAIKTEALKKE